MALLLAQMLKKVVMTIKMMDPWCVQFPMTHIQTYHLWHKNLSYLSFDVKV